MNKLTSFFLLFVFIAINITAQSTQKSTSVHVIGETLYFQHVNTKTEIPLAIGASAPLAPGDHIRTGLNGRALITVSQDNHILLLPNSEYEIISFTDDELIATFIGIAIHNFSTPVNYQLTTETFEIIDGNGLFAVWSVPDGLQTVVSVSDEVTMQVDEEMHPVSPEQGFAFPYSIKPVTLESPFHASQVIQHSVDCQGIVTTNGGEGLRLRAGAALDYQIVDVLYDGQEVEVVGTTQNGLWYRIPFQTGFGWIYSSLIAADCTRLQEFPNLIAEQPERIFTVTEEELELLEPFYGSPESNTVFYR